MADPIEQLLDEAILSARAKRDQARLLAKGGDSSRTHLYVSEVGTVIGESACWRKLFYDFHGAPKDGLTLDTLLAFEVGDLIGLRLANMLAAIGAVEKVELPLSFGEFPVSGRLDVLISTDRRVVEIKSATTKQRGYLPKREHLEQCNLYVHGVRLIPEYADVSSGVVLYIIKDAAKGHPVRLAFPVPYDAGSATKALEQFKWAHVVATGTHAPKRPTGFTQSKWPCAYCSFLTHCWSRPENGTGQEVPF